MTIATLDLSACPNTIEIGKTTYLVAIPRDSDGNVVSAHRLHGILPQPLVPVEDAPVPKELAALHFGDIHLALRRT